MARVAWRARLDELKALIDGGANRSDLRAHFGCSESALHNALNEYGLTLRPEAAKAARAASARRLNADPDIARRAREAAYKARISPQGRRNASEARKRDWQRPEYREHITERARAYMRSLPPEELRERIRFAHDANMARRRAAAARLEAQQAEAARLAAMTPWERQLDRARRFGITERPRFVAREYDYSLIGSALA